MSSSMHSGSSSGSRLPEAAQEQGREGDKTQSGTMWVSTGLRSLRKTSSGNGRDTYLRMSLQYSSAVRGQPRFSRKLICL